MASNLLDGIELDSVKRRMGNTDLLAGIELDSVTKRFPNYQPEVDDTAPTYPSYEPEGSKYLDPYRPAPTSEQISGFTLENQSTLARSLVRPHLTERYTQRWKDAEVTTAEDYTVSDDKAKKRIAALEDRKQRASKDYNELLAVSAELGGPYAGMAQAANQYGQIQEQKKEQAKYKPIGVGENLGRNVTQYTGVFGDLFSVMEQMDFKLAVERLEGNDYKDQHPDLKKSDENFVKQTISDMHMASIRGTTFTANVALGVAQLPAFMAEFAASGVPAKGVVKNLFKGLVKQGKSKVAKAVLRKGGAVATRGAVRTAFQGATTTDDALSRTLPTSYTKNKDGSYDFEGGEEDLSAAIKAIGGTLIENISEDIGAYLLPKSFTKKFNNALYKVLKISDDTLTPPKFLKALKTGGYNGFIEENLEEFVGSLARAGTGVEDYGTGAKGMSLESMATRVLGALKDTWDNKYQQAAILGVPALIGGGAGYVKRKRVARQEKNREEADQAIELLAKDAIEAERSKGDRRKDAQAVRDSKKQTEPDRDIGELRTELWEAAGQSNEAAQNLARMSDEDVRGAYEGHFGADIIRDIAGNEKAPVEQPKPAAEVTATATEATQEAITPAEKVNTPVETDKGLEKAETPIGKAGAVGEKRGVMGIKDAELVEQEIVDGVEYQLWQGKEGSVIRVYDVDSGQSVDMRKYPVGQTDAAVKEYAKTIKNVQKTSGTPTTGEISPDSAEITGGENSPDAEKQKKLSVDHPIDDLTFDPERFQFRFETRGPEGKSGSLNNVKVWDDNLAGIVLVWRDPADNKTYVVNGHNRVSKAIELGETTFPVVRYIDAENESVARSIGALTNIAEGNGTAIDAAKFIKETNQTRESLAEAGVPLHGEMVTDGLALANLHPALFNDVIRGVLPLKRAALIGAKLADHSSQMNLVTLLNKQKKQLTNSVVSELIDLVAGGPKEQVTQVDLFGEEVITKDYTLEKAQVTAYIKSQLQSDKRLFGVVSKGANKLERGGNKIDVKTSKGISEESATLLEIFDSINLQKSEIGDILNIAAKEIAGGKNVEKIKQDAYSEVREALPGIISGRTEASSKGNSDLFATEEKPASKESISKPTKTAPSVKTVDQQINDTPDIDGSVLESPDVTAEQVEYHKNVNQQFPIEAEGKGKPVTKQSIISWIETAFDVPIRGKLTHPFRKSLGHYQTKAQGIRMVDVRSLLTASHEIGHHIDHKVLGRFSKDAGGNKAIYEELTTVGKKLYGKRKPNGGYRGEGFAEFIRGVSFSNQFVLDHFPATLKWFNTTFKNNNPKAFSNIKKLEQRMQRYMNQGAESRVEAMINRKPIRRSAKKTLRDGWLWFRSAFDTEYAPVEDFIKKAGIIGLKDSENPAELLTAFTMTSGSKARTMVLRNTMDVWGRVTGKGLKEVIAPVAKDIKEFTRYIVSWRSLNLEKRGINSGISKEDALHVFNQYDNPAWREVAKEITLWNQRVLQVLVDTGVLQQDQLDLMVSLNPIYVPFARAFMKGELVSEAGGSGKGVTDQAKGVHAIKGSGREIIDPFEQMIKQTENIIAIAQKAAVARSLVQLSENKEGIARFIWKIPAPRQATSFSAEQIKKDILQIAADKFGLDLSEGMPSEMLEQWDEILTVFSNAKEYGGKDNVISLVVDGKRTFYQVEPMLYRALRGLDKITLNLLGKIAAFVPKLQRLGATQLNPSFSLGANPIRDAMDITFKAKHAKIPFLTTVIGTFRYLSTTKLSKKLGFKPSFAAQQFIDVGGQMAGLSGQDRSQIQHLRGELLANSVKGFAIETVKHPIDVLREIFGVSESGPRIQEYKKALEFAEKKYGKGSPDAIIYAINAARDQSINFTRHGFIGKYANIFIPFWNAGAQDISKTARTFKTRPIAATLNAITYLTMPALALWYYNKDEEWWKELDAHEKWNNIHFKIGNKIIRLPVPFLVGHIFQGIPVALADSLYRKDPDSIKEMMGMAWKRNFKDLARWPTIVQVPMDVAANKSWSGRPIVSKSAEGKLPEDQVATYTKDFAKAMGKVLNLSPAKIEYVLNQVSGGLYRNTHTAVDALRGKSEKSDQPSDIPILGRFFLRDQYAPRKTIEAFYDRLDLLSRKKNSDKITDAENEERLEMARKRKDLRDVWKELKVAKFTAKRKKLYKQVKDIINNPRPDERGKKKRSRNYKMSRSQAIEILNKKQ